MKRWWQELNPVRQSQETLNRPVHKIIIQEAKLEFTRIYNFSDQADTEHIFELQILFTRSQMIESNSGQPDGKR